MHDAAQTLRSRGSPYGKPLASPLRVASTDEAVLVVDDDEDMRFLVTTALECSGIAVAEASNGQEALDSVHQTRPAVVLLDLMMPVMSGAEFLEALRSDERYGDVPVLLLTAWPEQAAHVKGVQGIVQKPLDVDELIDVTSRMLHREA